MSPFIEQMYKDNGIDISLSRFEITFEAFRKLDSEPDYHKGYGYSVGHKGFFILDGDNFNEILEAHQNKDLNQRKIDLDIFSKYPEDNKKDEFKKLIIEPNKNTFFWDRVIQDECVYNITKKSLFCTTEGIRQILEHDSNNRKELALEYQLPESFMHAHGLINKPETANEFYIINKQINTEEELQKIISNSKERVEIGAVTIENNKIGFFHPNDFKVNNKDDYKQRFFKCENGEYKIKAFFEKDFERNFNTMKEFKKLSSDYEEEYNDSVQKLFGYPGELDYHYLEQNDERVIALKNKFDDQVKSLRKKYLIENIGCLYFQIKKEKNS
jgi:hypothetical protein